MLAAPAHAAVQLTARVVAGADKVVLFVVELAEVGLQPAIQNPCGIRRFFEQWSACLAWHMRLHCQLTHGCVAAGACMSMA